jgi:hypothetical protein
MEPLPDPIKSLIIISLFLIFIDMVDDGVKIYKRVNDWWTWPALVSGIMVFVLFIHTAYIYW